MDENQNMIVEDKINRRARDEAESAGLIQQSDAKQEAVSLLDCFKCRLCRQTLFQIKEVVKHIKGQDADASTKTEAENADQKDLCQEQLYIEPQDWFEERLTDISGKIHCPKCESKVGTFDWCGSRCTCGSWITPAFRISKTKVDYHKNV